MKKKAAEIPPISDQENTPLVKTLVEMIYGLQEQNQNLALTIQQLRDEIAILKGERAKPVFKSGRMDKNTDKDDDEGEGRNGGAKKKRAGSHKRSKTVELTIHEEKVIRPESPVPPGSRFNGYSAFVVQGLKIEVHNIRYRLEKWLIPDGKLVTATLPAELQGHHFDPTLRAFILQQHHHCQVTQPLLLEELREWGIDISAGQIDAILSADHGAFHREKNAVLVTGLEVSGFITVDDSGARHQGKNGYVTQIGNELFAWFASTSSKSRINFLELLHAGAIRYQVTNEALVYMKEQGLSSEIREQLHQQTPKEISTTKDWQSHIETLNIKAERQVRIATEGALIGGLLEKGFNSELAIISDGAGQFAIFLHALCWIHAERLIHKLIPVNELQRVAIALVRSQIWTLYADLKAYKVKPDTTQIATFESRFTSIFTQCTGFITLDRLLERLHGHKDELLLVLRRPDIPLHTNGSETDIRDYVKKRKVSGGTRSDLGRQCRDTFASLKKTCRKLGISYWQYLLDRVSLKNAINPLPTLIRHASALGASP